MKKVSNFKNRLHEAIATSGFQQIEVAKLAGISKSLLNKYLKGISEAGNDKLYSLAITLNVNPVWLMGYDVEKDNTEINTELQNPEKVTLKDQVLGDGLLREVFEELEHLDDVQLRKILQMIKLLKE